MSKIKSIINGIKNIFYYLPYIWKDRDWDYHFMYELLYAKLNRMDNYWENCDDWIRSKNHEKEHRRIKIAKNLAKRLSEENYLDNALFWHRRKYDDYLDFISDEPDENGYYRHIPDSYKERSDSFDRCCKHSDNTEKQDMEMFFNLLNKRIKGWWI